jgi:tRNA(Ile)-lysidine synthase
LTRLVSDSLTRLRLPEGRLVVALSGGADSAALALLTNEAGREATALHVDHQLPASPRMASAARSIARRLDMEIAVETVVVEAGPSPEARARDARYQVFERVDGPIVTAHTRDDHAETLLINLIRGTGPTGLAGIPFHRAPHIYRPTLSLGRNVTREIASLAGLEFVDDPMNDDLSLTRNRLRQMVMPMLEEINPRVIESLARAADVVGRDREYLESLVTLSAGARSIPISVLVTSPRPLADRLLVRLLEGSGIGATADRVERLWSVANSEAQSQDLASGHSVVRRGALLIIE